MELKMAHGLFTDCWHLYKQYYETDLGDKDLMDFTVSVEKLRIKHENNKFANDLLIAVIEEIGRIAQMKHREKSADKNDMGGRKKSC